MGPQHYRFGLPFILWATSAPPTWLPMIIKQNWYELCFYTHAIGAWITVLMALYARFEVFFPILIGWGILAMDYIREGLFHTWSVPLVVDATSKATRQDGTQIVRCAFSDKKLHSRGCHWIPRMFA
jgi:hypothetical protein